jgi:hypothetical protein
MTSDERDRNFHYRLLNADIPSPYVVVEDGDGKKTRLQNRPHLTSHHPINLLNQPLDHQHLLTEGDISVTENAAQHRGRVRQTRQQPALSVEQGLILNDQRLWNSPRAPERTGREQDGLITGNRNPVSTGGLYIITQSETADLNFKQDNPVRVAADIHHVRVASNEGYRRVPEVAHRGGMPEGTKQDPRSFAPRGMLAVPGYHADDGYVHSEIVPYGAVPLGTWARWDGRSFVVPDGAEIDRSDIDGAHYSLPQGPQPYITRDIHGRHRTYARPMIATAGAAPAALSTAIGQPSQSAGSFGSSKPPPAPTASMQPFSDLTKGPINSERTAGTVKPAFSASIAQDAPSVRIGRPSNSSTPVLTSERRHRATADPESPFYSPHAQLHNPRPSNIPSKRHMEVESMDSGDVDDLLRELGIDPDEELNTDSSGVFGGRVETLGGYEDRRNHDWLEDLLGDDDKENLEPFAMHKTGFQNDYDKGSASFDLGDYKYASKFDFGPTSTLFGAPDGVFNDSQDAHSLDSLFQPELQNISMDTDLAGGTNDAFDIAGEMTTDFDQDFVSHMDLNMSPDELLMFLEDMDNFGTTRPETAEQGVSYQRELDEGQRPDGDLGHGQLDEGPFGVGL